jgi:hypothetical protein
MGFWASERYTPATKSLFRSMFLNDDILHCLIFLRLVRVLYNMKKQKYCEGRKEFAHTMVIDHNSFCSLKTLAHFLFRTFGGFLHVPTTSLAGSIVSETRITNIYLNTMHDLTAYI